MYDGIMTLSIFLSLFYYEFVGIAPSGLIVPGYIALNAAQPEKILFTFLIALMTYALVRLLSRFLIIYGKRQFALCVGVAILLNLLIGQVLFQNEWSVIGRMIAGIMANAWIRDGLMKSALSLIVVVLLLLVVMLAFGGSLF